MQQWCPRPLVELQKHVGLAEPGLGSPKPALDTTSHGLEGIYGQAIDKGGRGRRLYETALSVFEVGRRGKSFTALMVEPARDGHEHDVDAEVGRREEVTV